MYQVRWLRGGEELLKNGYIKMHRSLLDWEWYDDINTTRLFLHLLLTVSIRDSEWHGTLIKRGSRITSYRVLSLETNLSERQVRTAIKHLEKTGEVTRQKKPNFTVFTISNYDKFQEATGQTPKKRQGSDKGVTGQRQGSDSSIRRYKEDIKEDIKKNKEESPVRQEPPGLLAARGLHINEGGDF